MDKKRIDFDKYIENSMLARFYKAKDSEEGYYHVCDKFLPDGAYRLEAMPEIFKHDVNVTLYLNNERLRIDYCPMCGVKVDC